MVVDCIRETVGCNAWQSLNLFIEYDHSIEDVSVEPVASEGIRIVWPQAVVHLYVLQPHAEHALIVWCVSVRAVRWLVPAASLRDVGE
jgi:hypothetical protein